MRLLKSPNGKGCGKMKGLINKESVLNILDEMAEVSKRNWDGDAVLLDMIATIRNRVEQLESKALKSPFNHTRGRTV